MIVHEALTGHLFKIVVASGHTATTDIEFAHHTNWQFIAVGIHDKLLHVELWFAYRDELGMGEFLVVGCHGNLSRSVAVEDTCLGHLAHLAQQLVGEFLTTGTAYPYVADGLAEILAGEPSLPARRSARHHVDALLLDEPCQVERVVGLFLGCHDECLAVEVSHTDVLQGGIEGDGGDTQHTVGICQHTMGKNIGGMTIEIVADAFMAQHHTLWTARRTAGVYQVGEVIGSDFCSDIIAGYRTGEQFFHVDGLAGWHGVHAVGGGDDIPCFTVLKNQLDSVCRVFWVAGDVGCSRLQHAEQREDEPAGAGQ